jgi:hypothetical protein
VKNKIISNNPSVGIFGAMPNRTFKNNLSNFFLPSFPFPKTEEWNIPHKSLYLFNQKNDYG